MIGSDIILIGLRTVKAIYICTLAVLLHDEFPNINNIHHSAKKPLSTR